MDPVNCRCAQALVIEEDMPSDVQELAAVDGLTVTDPLSERQRDIYHEHSKPGEPMKEMLQRLDGSYSRTQLAKHIGTSSTTLYQWLREYGLY